MRRTTSPIRPASGPASGKYSPSMPQVWFRSISTVIRSVASRSATRKSGKYCLSGTARSTRPSSTSCITSVAVSTLVIEPMCITVSAVTSTPVVTLVTPVAAISHWPSRNTAALAPGTLCFWIDAPSRLVRLPLVVRSGAAGADCSASLVVTAAQRQGAPALFFAPRFDREGRGQRGFDAGPLVVHEAADDQVAAGNDSRAPGDRPHGSASRR